MLHRRDWAFQIAEALFQLLKCHIGCSPLTQIEPIKLYHWFGFLPLCSQL